jgi:hypothetical protein
LGSFTEPVSFTDCAKEEKNNAELMIRAVSFFILKILFIKSDSSILKVELKKMYIAQARK